VKKIKETKLELMKKLAYLESINDQLSSEVSYVNHLMQLVGFADGLKTVKAAAEEIIHKGLKKIYEN
jgi:hypothetical protein